MVNDSSRLGDAAVAFVQDLDLPPLRGGRGLSPQGGVSRESGSPTRTHETPAATQGVLDSASKAGLVVGSSVISFVEGVPAEARSDIINCSLLAQLAANRKVPDRERV